MFNATVDHADMRGLGTDSSRVRRGAACALGSAIATRVAANNVVEGSPDRGCVAFPIRPMDALWVANLLLPWLAEFEAGLL